MIVGPELNYRRADLTLGVPLPGVKPRPGNDKEKIERKPGCRRECSVLDDQSHITPRTQFSMPAGSINSEVIRAPVTRRHTTRAAGRANNRLSPRDYLQWLG
jgi:hypothetical protein